MTKSPPSAYKRWVLALVSICGFACTVIAGNMLLKKGGLALPFFTRETEASQTAVRVEYRTEYLKCGDALVEYRDYQPPELDSVMADLYQTWAVTKEEEQRVSLLRQVDEYCDTHYRLRLITIYRGYVCVFRGKEADSRFLVRERPDIRETDLAPRDRNFLKNGHVIEAGPEVSHEDVPATLEREVAIYLEGIKEH
ncbi:MAG TPA: hypothetical protein GX512_04175 [Firmicutes bacterium]|nr:hypothetical protein [Candidatus Fermentithermobacillaceae bacterium]